MIDNTMTKRQKDIQHNDQKTEGLDNTMTKRQKDGQHNDQKTEGCTTQ